MSIKYIPLMERGRPIIIKCAVKPLPSGMGI